MRLFPFPSREDRQTLRLLFDERCESFQEDRLQDNTAVALTSEQIHALWLDHVRPSSGIQNNIPFTVFWTWLCLVHQYPIPVFVGLAVLFFFTVANVYHWIKMLVLNIV